MISNEELDAIEARCVVKYRIFTMQMIEDRGELDLVEHDEAPPERGYFTKEEAEARIAELKAAGRSATLSGARPIFGVDKVRELVQEIRRLRKGEAS